jgi:hypothetical protein
MMFERAARRYKRRYFFGIIFSRGLGWLPLGFSPGSWFVVPLGGTRSVSVVGDASGMPRAVNRRHVCGPVPNKRGFLSL